MQDVVAFDAEVKAPDGTTRQLHGDVYRQATVQTRGALPLNHWILREPNSGQLREIVPKDSLSSLRFLKPNGELSETPSEGDAVLAEYMGIQYYAGRITKLLPVAQVGELGDK